MKLEDVRSTLHSRELRHKASSSKTESHASVLFVSGGKGCGNGKKSKDKKPFHRGPKPEDICNN